MTSEVNFWHEPRNGNKPYDNSRWVKLGEDWTRFWVTMCSACVIVDVGVALMKMEVRRFRVMAGRKIVSASGAFPVRS